MSSKLQKKDIIHMIFFSLITFGIYIPVWFLKQRKIINKLKSKKKLSKRQLIAALIIFIISAIFLIFSIIYIETPLGDKIDNVGDLVNWISMVFIIVISFRVKGILENHFKEDFSELGTFFFSIFYLQYKINQSLK